MNDIVIYGAGGFAREVRQLLLDVNQAVGRWNVLGYLDDDRSLEGAVVGDLTVLGTSEWISRLGYSGAVVLGVGSPVAKRKVVERLQPFAVEYPTILHPSASIGERVVLKEGVVITAGNILTADIDLNEFAMVNLACTIGHDVRIGSMTTLSPGVHLSGCVQVAEGVDVGTGAVFVPGVSVGEWSVVGAGAVVTKDFPANCTAVGIPARMIKAREPGWHLV